MFVAETDGELVAYISAGLAESPPIYERGLRAHVDGLYVTAVYRRNGIETSLIERVEEWAKANGCDTLGISVHTNNEEARKLYEQDFDRTFLSYHAPWTSRCPLRPGHEEHEQTHREQA